MQRNYKTKECYQSEVNVLQLADTHVGFSNYAQELKWITTTERIESLAIYKWYD